MSPPRLAEVVRGFGVEPDRIRRIAARNNVHWRVASGADRYVLRRYGDAPDLRASALWEHAVVEALADLGAPAPRAVAEPRQIGGAFWLLMPALSGWSLGYRPCSDDGYRRMGRDLARLHDRIERLAPCAQRPGWGSFVDAALPLEGGRDHRESLLDDLRAIEPAAADRYAAALEAFEARDLPGVFAGAARHAIHGDVSPWNLRYRNGEVSAVLDFELAHVDVLAADLACARRGYHDPVVEGYLQHRVLPEAEIAVLDALWLGGIFHGLWRELETWRRTSRPRPERVSGWALQQLDKIRPYRPA